MTIPITPKSIVHVPFAEATLPSDTIPCEAQSAMYDLLQPYILECEYGKPGRRSHVHRFG
jgi:hypothetical protein